MKVVDESLFFSVTSTGGGLFQICESFSPRRQRAPEAAEPEVDIIRKVLAGGGRETLG